jgi:hypothetical protein
MSRSFRSLHLVVATLSLLLHPLSIRSLAAPELVEDVQSKKEEDRVVFFDATDGHLIQDVHQVGRRSISGPNKGEWLIEKTWTENTKHVPLRISVIFRCESHCTTQASHTQNGIEFWPDFQYCYFAWSEVVPLLSSISSSAVSFGQSGGVSPLAAINLLTSTPLALRLVTGNLQYSRWPRSIPLIVKKPSLPGDPPCSIERLRQ